MRTNKANEYFECTNASIVRRKNRILTDVNLVSLMSNAKWERWLSDHTQDQLTIKIVDTDEVLIVNGYMPEDGGLIVESRFIRFWEVEYIKVGDECKKGYNRV